MKKKQTVVHGLYVGRKSNKGNLIIEPRSIGYDVADTGSHGGADRKLLSSVASCVRGINFAEEVRVGSHGHVIGDDLHLISKPAVCVYNWVLPRKVYGVSVSDFCAALNKIGYSNIAVI